MTIPGPRQVAPLASVPGLPRAFLDGPGLLRALVFHAAAAAATAPLPDNLPWRVARCLALDPDDTHVLVDGEHALVDEPRNKEFYGVSLAPSGELFAVYGTRQCVLRWPSVLLTHAGAEPLTATVVAGGNGCGAAHNQLSGPTGLYRADDDGALYVADSGNNRVVRWPCGAAEGTTVAGDGTQGAGLHQLNCPAYAVATADQRAVYVSDAGNHRVVRWDAGASTGVLLLGLQWPNGLCLAGADLYVVEEHGHRVVLWREGLAEPLNVAGEPGRQGATATQLFSPEGVALTASGDLLVVDKFNCRVQLFRKGERCGTTVLRVPPLEQEDPPHFPVGVAVHAAAGLFVISDVSYGIKLGFLPS